MEETTSTQNSGDRAQPARHSSRSGEREKKGMTFGKTFLATVLGFFTSMVVVGFICFVIIAGIIGAVISSEEEGPYVADGSVLVLKLGGAIPEFVGGVSVNDLLSDFNPTTTMDYVRALYAAAEDDNISGLWLKFSGYRGSPAQLEELTRAISAFKESGKFVYATASPNGYGEGEYVLAAAADSLFMPISGFVELNGLYAQVEFYKPLMDKLNIKPMMVRAGTYKAAVEPFTRESASPEYQEAIQSLIDGQYAVMRRLVSEGRSMSEAAVDSIVNKYPVILAENALEEGLVDRLIYDDEEDGIFKAAVNGSDTTKSLHTIDVHTYLRSATGGLETGTGPSTIAIVYASGSINTGENDYNPSPIFGGDMLGSESFVREMRRARENESVKAVVLRINSPGGSLSPTVAMWREVKLTAAVKPVVVSMANMAASGGYYLAAAADEIIAEEATITGSIGVFALGMNLDGFFEKTIGINTEVYRTGPHADLLSGTRDMTAEEMEFAEQRVNEQYRKFLNVVAEGRNMSVDDVEKAAEGRVWTGRQAKELGLVDELGGIEFAIQRAAERADITEYRLREYPQSKNKMELIMDLLDLEGAAASDLREKAATLNAPVESVYEQARASLEQFSGVQARLVGLRAE